MSTSLLLGLGELLIQREGAGDFWRKPADLAKGVRGMPSTFGCIRAGDRDLLSRFRKAIIVDPDSFWAFLIGIRSSTFMRKTVLSIKDIHDWGARIRFWVPPDFPGNLFILQIM
jgi:hypothetical protein